ncbi:MAG: hypothetical protein ACOC7N_04685 [Chloroflexota bacterium]
MLRRLLKAYAVELRLLVWHWSYPLLHMLLLALLLGFGESLTRGHTALGALETMLGSLSIGLVSLVGIFAAGLGASRAARVKTAELEWTFPTGGEVLLGRWLAGVTALLGFLVEPVFIAGRQGPTSSLLAGLPTFIGEAALTLAFTTAGAWWLARRLPLGRWSYPLLAAGWLGFLAGPTMLVNRFSFLSLFNFMRVGTMSYHSELWRRVAYGESFLWFNLFYAGLLLLFLGLLLWQEGIRRFRRPSLPGGVLVLGALALALFAGLNYIAPTRQIQARGLGLLWSGPIHIAPTPVTAPPAPAPAVAGMQVEGYDLTLDLSEGDQVAIEVTLTVRNTGEAPVQRFDLELDPDLEVVAADVAFTQQGATLWLDLPRALPPDEQRAIELRYGGPIWDAYLDDGIPVAEVFVHPRGVRLSPLVAWYPRLPGEGALTGRSSPQPYRFRLALEGTGDLHFGSNLPVVGPHLFVSEDATWVYLVGSPFLVTEELDDVLLVTARDGLEQVRSLVSVYTDALAHLQRFMPDVPVEGLTLMVLDTGMLPNATPPSDGRVVVAVGRSVLYGLNSPDGYNFPMLWDALLYDLWRLGDGALDGGVAWPVRQTAVFLWMHHGCNGDVACIDETIEAHTSQMSPGSRERYLPAILFDIYEAEGKEAIIEILRQFRLNSEAFVGMPEEALHRWLREGDYDR